MYHNPVMLHESVEALNIRPGGVYVDATFGGGGHSRAILEKLGNGRLIGFDQDEDAAANVPQDERFIFVSNNFRYLRNFLRYYGFDRVDGILADLGVSSFQIDAPQRGFSTRFEGVLDMRMDRSNPLDAATVVNTYSLEDLTRIFNLYGELPQARRFAEAVLRARPIHTTGELRKSVEKLLPKGKEHKPLAQLFQALRIEVNQELEVLEEFLQQSIEMLDNGGRLVVIAYHSLEDRLVKNYMKAGNASGESEKDFFGNSKSSLRPVSRKALTPSDEELQLNNRSRSARLRVAEKVMMP
ncbi:MAG: 16S rRNA (cytosine(1402)-N(4))-methyltransferase RsmH [Bacteroidia bacterium]|jgi:16S rRNA (cytosine1402-N4)-methyltransferase|nr:16S rRNA (cytosine(1402)-N(4))-methyltransferase RsmH [Bacteroidia bacterium]